MKGFAGGLVKGMVHIANLYEQSFHGVLSSTSGQQEVFKTTTSTRMSDRLTLL